MNRVVLCEVTAGEAGQRLDRWFKRRFPHVTHARLQKLLRTGQVRIDGRRAKAGLRLEAGQMVRVPPLATAAGAPADAARPRPVPPVSRAEAETLQGRVLYLDDDVIVLDKPSGLVVQGGTGTGRHLDAMLDALRFGAAERPRLVHRLDKDTSGVLLLARHGQAATRLTAAFRSNAARKLYWAVVVGVPRPSQGRIDMPLAKAAGRHGERVVGDEDAGKRAVTLYRIVERAGRTASWLALEPQTGRTHQLRVHAAALGTPILGDGKYSGKRAFLAGAASFKRLHLHARAIRIPHPRSGVLEVTAPLPVHMAATWRFFGFDPDAPQAGFESGR
jgi:23S rRNA pseudouridine955/2504/2580 synthase